VFQRSLRKLKTGLSLAVFAAAGATAVNATQITFSAAQNNLAASVTFDTMGSNLVVTLENTSAADVLAPADVLTAVFFDVAGGTLTLDPTTGSAVLAPGSSVAFGASDPGGVVGGEWAYASGLSGAPHGAAYGISSSGFNLFGAANFPGSNLQGPVAVDGIQYGLTSLGDNLASGNAAVTGSNALIQNAVTFTIPGLPAGFDPSTVISNVSFQYGTDLSEPNIPEPASISLLAIGLLAFRRR
jgi:hypothetical protein